MGVCEICRVLDHRAETCLEGEVVLVNESPSGSENRTEVWMDVGHVDMRKHGMSKAAITYLELEEARVSIEGM